MTKHSLCKLHKNGLLKLWNRTSGVDWVVENFLLIPRNAHKKVVIFQVMHEVIHNINSYAPQVW